MIEDSKNSMYHSYRLNFDFELLYLINHSNSNRVCISASMKRRVMKYAHDNHVHDDFHKIINRLKQTTHFFKMRVKINRYIESCSTCQLSKSIKKSFYEQFHFIKIIAKSFIKFSMNFIVALLMTVYEHNALFTIIDRFFKYVRLISNREDWEVSKWIKIYYEHVYRHWSLSNRIVFDRNSKFISDFWTMLFERSEIKLDFITAFHSFAND